MNVDNVLATAVVIAKEAGALLREGFTQEKEIVLKSSAVDWVTQFDQAAEKLITEKLQTTFPTHGLIGEEGSVRRGDGVYTWYVDPLDGTTNFSHGFPLFCVSLALYEGCQPLVGVVYDPMQDDCFTAVAGGGAFLLKGEQKIKLHVSQTETLIRSLVATGFPYDRHTSPQNNLAQLERFLKTTHGIRRAGAAALDMAYVAAGRFDGYWEFKLNSWDVAAGILLVQEAGGRVTDMSGHDPLIAPVLELVVSNGRIHNEMLAVL